LNVLLYIECHKKYVIEDRLWWIIPVILATWETEIWKSKVDWRNGSRVRMPALQT
jgi:hypothetical protein